MGAPKGNQFALGNDGGRYQVTIDWEKVDHLMIRGCLGTEVAAFFGIHPNTFYRRVEEHYGMSFSDYSSQKKSTGEALLRAQQFDKALGYTKKGDNTLLIWLGKQRLDQKESIEVNKEPPNDKLISQEHELIALRHQLKQKESNGT